VDLEKRTTKVATATALRGEGLTLAEIGKRMGYTRQRVHQLLTRGR
jgi:DNA-directed RNA polymerase sigma subunit (sigma70/sigma32)